MLKHLANRCCVGSLSIETHTTDRRPNQSHSNATSQSGQCRLKKLRVRRFKLAVLANKSRVTMRTAETFPLTTSSLSKIDSEWLMPGCRRPSQRSHNKSEATTQIVAFISDTFSEHDTPVPAPCTNNCATMECLSILVTHASAPLYLPRSVDPWEKNVAPSRARSGKKLQFFQSFEHAR